MLDQNSAVNQKAASGSHQEFKLRIYFFPIVQGPSRPVHSELK